MKHVRRFFTSRISIRYSSYPERLAILNLEELNIRRIRLDLLMYYKICHGPVLQEIILTILNIATLFQHSRAV